MSQINNPNYHLILEKIKEIELINNLSTEFSPEEKHLLVTDLIILLK